MSDYWAVERTHADAKTIALAARFVDEAFALVQHAGKPTTLQWVDRTEQNPNLCRVARICGKKIDRQ